MTTPSPLTQKSKNRVKSILGSLGVGEKIDLGRPHAKGFRLTVGRTVTGTQARFWLGQNENEAQQRAQAVAALWGDMASSGVTLWTAELIASAKSWGDQKVTMLRKVAATFQREAGSRDAMAVAFRSRVNDLIGVPSLPAPTAPPASVDAKKGSPLYEAMTAYEKSLASKRMTPGHRGQIKHIL
jgi:hypothetical protein